MTSCASWSRRRSRGHDARARRRVGRQRRRSRVAALPMTASHASHALLPLAQRRRRRRRLPDRAVRPLQPLRLLPVVRTLERAMRRLQVSPAYDCATEPMPAFSSPASSRRRSSPSSKRSATSICTPATARFAPTSCARASPARTRSSACSPSRSTGACIDAGAAAEDHRQRGRRLQQHRRRRTRASRGIVVTNTPDVLTESVADFTWALILGDHAAPVRRASGWSGAATGRAGRSTSCSAPSCAASSSGSSASAGSAAPSPRGAGLRHARRVHDATRSATLPTAPRRCRSIACSSPPTSCRCTCR